MVCLNRGDWKAIESKSVLWLGNLEEPQIIRVESSILSLATNHKKQLKFNIMRKEVREFIEKLERVNFTSVKDRDTLVSRDGFELSYSTKLGGLYGPKDNCGFEGLPVQLLFRVTKDGEYIQSWGCMELEDTTELAKWFVLKKNELLSTQREIERKKESVSQLIWKNI